MLPASTSAPPIHSTIEMAPKTRKMTKPVSNARALAAGLTLRPLATTVAAKYVGGVVHLRDHADSGRAPLNPVPAAKQRQALKLITDGLFRAESFKFKPAFVARLVPDQFDRWFGGEGRNLAAVVNPDVSISGAVLALQRGALDQLMADGVAARILDAPSKMADAKQAFALSELYDTLQGAIWSELQAGGDINPLRRNLQREHLKRLQRSLDIPMLYVSHSLDEIQHLADKVLVLEGFVMFGGIDIKSA